ncbi:trifunctional serine/threonine-protein kinase/ATP-binding protein/sensor histidine kinase [Dapis sp. BLCC M229]|uniref:trifunctional serine/threonine-protein kinase/ATP-binding protein/sensor histidine kinase n=1 Tax=Dapis sp. BLCC M229 TaxID=3400188 RepID=UPI003CEECDC5
MIETQAIKIANHQTHELIHESERTLVYRGRNIESRQQVIIKLMAQEYPSFNELVQFRNQYAIAKNLDIKGIVKPYSLLRYNNGYALIMEDIGAISLAEYQHQLSVSLPQFWEIALSVTEILHHLHQNQIIHKDIKPANILIHQETKEVRLIDFSISSLLPKETQSLQTPNVLEGTLVYISPEQTGRMNRGIDYRSDFYSLGVTFYELLTGKLPFESEDPLELVHAHIAKTPPSIPDTQVPKPLANIVMKLMAKNAEQRYQSALGLKYDLEKCRVEYEETGKIEPFVLGERDRSDRFLIPEKLYGREKEVQILLDAFERVASPNPSLKGGRRGEKVGNSEMMLVAGFSGIGKTAVVNEVHKPITRQKGYFIKGKFDQFNRNIPFSAFFQAFRDLMGQLLGESDAQLQEWKGKILEALGENGQVLIEVIPELQHIIGEQPRVPELSGSAAQNRFNLLFEKFIAVFTTIEHPLTLFLDDLQWADSASLNLLKVLMGNTQTGYLLMLGAYRDNEVFPAHPLIFCLGELEKQQTTISTITLAPLSVNHINQLVAETLSCSVELAAPLTDLVYQNTKGNPFFTTQFLKGLHEDELITFNQDLGYWECDLVKVRDAALTDDVVEFMARRLHKLPEETQKVLKLAACIANQFDLETLAIICETPDEEIAAALWSALREGLILPQSEAYKFFQGWEGEREDIEGIAVGYRFLHDRVQQAAHTLIPEHKRGQTHLNIGRALLAHLSLEKRQEQVLEIVKHFNIELSLLTSPEEIEQVVQLNKFAGEKAKRSTAYAAAITYFERAMTLLGNTPWQQQRELAFYFSENIAEAAFLSGDFAKASERVAILKQEAENILEEIKAIEIEMQIAQARHEQLQCLKIALSALLQLGVELPEYPTQEDVRQELRELDTALAGTEVGDIAKLPPIQNREIKAAMQILASMLSPCYQVRMLLFQLVSIRQLQLTVQWGLSCQSPIACALYGMVLIVSWLDVERGYQFGRLGVELLERPGLESVKSTTQHLFYNHIQNIKDSARVSLQPSLVAGLAGIEAGEYQDSGNCILVRFLTAYFAGVELDILERDLGIYREVLEQTKQETTLKYYCLLQQVVANLTSSIASIDFIGEFFNEKEIVPALYEKEDRTGIGYFIVHKLTLCCLFEEVSRGIEVAGEVEKYISNLAGMLCLPAVHFYNCLLRLKAAEQQKVQSQEIIIGESFEKSLEQLCKFAACAPVNYEHKRQLIEAERYRILGQKLEAMECYDRAIAGAKANEYIQEEAIANELFAKFYLDWGREKEAAVYMQEAYYSYAQWGAKAKANDLEKRYPQLLAPILQRQQLKLTTNDTIANITKGTVSNTSTCTGELLDLASLMKASRTLSKEIDLEQAIANFIEVIQENAGADTVALMLFRQETLILEAKIADGETKSIKSIPVEDSLEVPLTIVNTVKHSRTSLLLDNAASETDYVRDRYIKENQPRSILCLPLSDRGQFIGIVYLENNQTMGAFTSERVEIIELLCAQAAITLENSRLYQQAQQAFQLERELHDLQQTQLQLIQSEKMFSLGQMVAGIAHEINNPISFIHGNITHANEYMEEVLELLALYQTHYPEPHRDIQIAIEAMDLEFLGDDFEKLLKSMKNGSERIKNIVTSLRTFARLGESELKRVDLHEGIESTLTILQNRFQKQEKRAEIQVEKDYGKLPLVECYAGQLNQVFLNVLNNAIDALSECSRQDSPTIRISTETDEKQVTIAIADNGVGMNQETQKRLFDPFFTTKQVGKGTGLGLAIAHQIITEKHGGQITCNSTFGQGTIFTIVIPR